MAKVREQQFILQISIPTLVQNSLVASPDLQRAAYISRFRDGMCVVVDGVEGEKFDGIGEGTIIFSLDSKRVAYVAGKSEKQFVVHDGQAGPAHDLTLKGPPALSANGEHLAYGVRKRGRWRVVRDGEELQEHGSLAYISMSQDGAHLAYAAIEPTGVSIVVDGVARRAYDGVLQGSLVLSPNGKDVAYGAHDGSRQLVVRSNVESKRYDGVPGKPVFSRDSRRLLHPADDENRQFIVLDGAAQPSFDYIVIGDNETFSPDGHHIAYVVKQGAHQHVAVDNVPGPAFDGISARSVCLSRDGRRIAYAARLGSDRFAVCDHRAKPPHANVWGLLFSPNGNHLAYVATVGRRHGVFVEDEPVFDCDGVLTAAAGHALRFDGDRILRFVALMGGALHSVELEF